MRNLILTALVMIAAATPVMAQTPAPPAAPPAGVAPKRPPKEPTLIYDREVFDYPAGGRKDPFRPLTNNDTSGPLFTELTITSIAYSANPSESVVTLKDLSKKDYRLHRGDAVGNAVIRAIEKDRVVFSIEEFGMKRLETLELKLTRAGGA